MRDEEMETNKINGRVMKEGLVFYEGCDGFTVEELMRASAEMVGRGPLGTTYKVEMGGGGGQRALAVKRVRVGRGRSLAEEAKMQEGLKEIGKLRHPNVAGLRAHCSSHKEVLLIYDYFNNGSLHSLLHGDRWPGRIPLDWTTRLKLASGAAKGLSFLHASNKSKLIPSHQHWVRKIVREEEYWTSKVLDLEILRYKEMESEMIALLQVALLCLATTPQDRPKMSIVYKMIEDIRERGSRGRVSASPSVISVISEDTPNFTSS
ncbi:putative leucine-rich repeat receptor-like protein kinase [Acorus gramineus]|uniref:Leucine-rich repeat receptor-like protein kinase n=1 Tax=Acorus gramineus TaxID=55184 RepID=A0AAV9ARG4_ACOGR|nr:putative leucine-rich repeat receptor-like protein kinase [Acorus gramineus]